MKKESARSKPRNVNKKPLNLFSVLNLCFEKVLKKNYQNTVKTSQTPSEVGIIKFYQILPSPSYQDFATRYITVAENESSQ